MSKQVDTTFRPLTYVKPDMKKLLSICLLSFIGIGISLAQETHNLTIEVRSIKKVVGNISICIVSEKGDFLKDCQIGRNVPIESTDFFVVFEDLPENSYAVSIFHDEDSNGELNMGKIVPIPKEKYGFSNNPSSTFGPPEFEECLFELSKDTIIIIEL